MIFAYLNAAFAVLSTLLYGPGIWLLLILLGGAAYFIANERRWAYYAAVGLSVLYAAGMLVRFFAFHSFSGALNLLFAGVLVGLLLHPMSRSYQRIWFH